MVSEASVDLRVYDVDFTFEYEHYHHSILEFTSLLTVVDGKKKKVFGDDCRCEENGNKKRKYAFLPNLIFAHFCKMRGFQTITTMAAATASFVDSMIICTSIVPHKSSE